MFTNEYDFNNSNKISFIPYKAIAPASDYSLLPKPA